MTPKKELGLIREMIESNSRGRVLRHASIGGEDTTLRFVLGDKVIPLIVTTDNDALSAKFKIKSDGVACKIRYLNGKKHITKVIYGKDSFFEAWREATDRI